MCRLKLQTLPDFHPGSRGLSVEDGGDDLPIWLLCGGQGRENTDIVLARQNLPYRSHRSQSPHHPRAPGESKGSGDKDYSPSLRHTS